MNKAINLLLVFILIALILSVFYYSWLPQPSFKSERYLPDWLIGFTDEYGVIRTGIPFIFLGFIANLLRNDFFTDVRIFLILAGVLLLAEFGQLFLPNRHFDILDILVGILSILAGQLVGKLFKK